MTCLLVWQGFKNYVPLKKIRFGLVIKILRLGGNYRKRYDTTKGKHPEVEKMSENEKERKYEALSFSLL